MPSKKPRIVIYLEPELNEELREWAEDERRTLNNLITIVLEERLEQRKKEKAKT